MSLQRIFIVAFFAFPHLLTASTVASYSGTFVPPQGKSPESSLLLGTDGNFYGTTFSGGSSGDGTVFKVTPGGTLTTLVNFNFANGANPCGRLILGSDGNFYGTTQTGGAYDFGTVFKMTPGGALTTLVSFNSTNGAFPAAGLIVGKDGNFYGTTQTGGSSSEGTVFELTSGGTLITLYNFTSRGGNNPVAGLIQDSNGNFYGTTESGGTYNDGAVFKLSSQGTLIGEFDFNHQTNGGTPEAGLIQGSDGNFYGTTAAGGNPQTGTYGYGTIFKMTPNCAVTIMVKFNGTNGSGPTAALTVGSDGNFYGTTDNGGSSYDGTFFQLTPDGTLTTLATFNSTNGAYPNAALIQGNDGNFYSVTVAGGSSGKGTVFKITMDGTLTTLVNFNGTKGSSPYGGVIQGSDGNIYGTTYYGGSSDDGTVFKLTPAGIMTTLVNFNSTNGANPYAGLIQGSDGNFYGTTFNGGAAGYGTIFKLTAGGALTTLTNFNTINGANPYAGLIQGSDGNFYGTTSSNGPSNAGTVFKVTPGGTLTTLASFTISSGVNPYGNLIQASDGNFYGTADLGGSSGNGTVFKMTSGGTLTTLVNFNISNANGACPFAGLIQGSDGNFYGTTEQGGSMSEGTVFKLTPSGTLTSFFTFSGPFNGTNSYAPLIQGSDGNFYGTTESGGSSNAGTVFQLTPSGTLTTLATFNFTNGAFPYAGLIQGGDGNFYGTTQQGGPANTGTVFRLDPTTSENVTFSSAAAIPIVASAYTITGSVLNLTLGYAPTPGTVLTVIDNTGSSSINGTFSNLPSGGTINSNFNGVTYTFAANYEGGDGNDLILKTIQTFSQWETQYSLTGGATGIPQHDGVPNLLKYFFDINPSVPMSTSDRAALPVFKIPPGTSNLTLAYRQNLSMTSVTVSVQTSPDLQTWTTVQNPSITQTGTDISTGDPLMLVQVPATGTREFIRLQITSP